jgi:hypothetical protein
MKSQQISIVTLNDTEESTIEFLHETFQTSTHMVQGFDIAGDHYIIPWSSILYIYRRKLTTK